MERLQRFRSLADGIPGAVFPSPEPLLTLRVLPCKIHRVALRPERLHLAQLRRQLQLLHNAIARLNLEEEARAVDRLPGDEQIPADDGGCGPNARRRQSSRAHPFQPVGC